MSQKAHPTRNMICLTQQTTALDFRIVKAPWKADTSRTEGVRHLDQRQGGSVCITSRWEPSRCSLPTWRAPLVCFSSWLSATPTCWRSTANSYAQHSNSGTVTRWTHKEMPSSRLLLAPPMPSQVQWQHNVPSPRISGPKERSCVFVWVYIQANQRFPLRATLVWTCILPHAL